MIHDANPLLDIQRPVVYIYVQYVHFSLAKHQQSRQRYHFKKPFVTRLNSRFDANSTFNTIQHLQTLEIHPFSITKASEQVTSSIINEVYTINIDPDNV